MKHMLTRVGTVRSGIGIATIASLTFASTALRAADPVDFKKDIAPIFAEHCVGCHGPEKQKGKFRLDEKAAAFKGGKSGEAAIVAKDLTKSPMHKRITLAKDNDDLMPPEGGPLPEATIKKIAAWIEQGADWPDDFVIKAVAKAAPEGSAPPPVATVPRKPLPPLPELPKDFKPSAGEAAAISSLAKLGVEPRPIAQNVPWKEANFRLKGGEITDAALKDVGQVTSLVDLRLGTTKVTDAGLEEVAKLDQLQALGLELTGITDAGIARLKGLKNLVYLNLYGTAVTDAALENLRDMTHLRSLYLWQTKVTPEGVKKLQDALPLMMIDTGAKLVLPEKKEEPKKEEKKEEKK